MRPINRTFTLLALAGALALSACGKKQEDHEAPIANELVEPPIDNVIVEEPDVTPPPSDNVVVPPPAPAPTVSEQQQILDDAAATGMTARLPDTRDTPPPADEASGKEE